jgi:hypothetical protein
MTDKDIATDTIVTVLYVLVTIFATMAAAVSVGLFVGIAIRAARLVTG